MFLKSTPAVADNQDNALKKVVLGLIDYLDGVTADFSYSGLPNLLTDYARSMDELDVLHEFIKKKGKKGDKKEGERPPRQ